MFRFPNHTLTNRKVQGKKVIWHVIVHSYLCNVSVSFSSKSIAINVFPKHILKSKARDQSNQGKKKSICHAIVKNYLCNVSRKFLIKIDSMWRHEIKEQAPRLTLLYRSRTIRSNHRRCCLRKLFLRISQYLQEATVLESIFKKSADLQTCNFIKKRPQQFSCEYCKMFNTTYF